MNTLTEGTPVGRLTAGWRRGLLRWGFWPAAACLVTLIWLSPTGGEEQLDAAASQPVEESAETVELDSVEPAEFDEAGEFADSGEAEMEVHPGALQPMEFSAEATEPEAAPVAELAMTVEATPAAPPVHAGQPGAGNAPRVDNNGRHGRIEIEMGSSTIIQVPDAISHSSVGDPDLVSVDILSPRDVLLSGRQTGVTQAILWTTDNQGSWNGESPRAYRVYEVSVLPVGPVQVEPDLARLRELLRRAAPGADVDIQVVRDTIVLTGRAPDADSAERIVALAGLASDKVLNHLVVTGAQDDPYARLGEMLRRSVPGVDVDVDIVGDKILLTGRVPDVGTAQRLVAMARFILDEQACGEGEKVLNQLTVAGEQQVLLRCTIAEVSRRGMKELGVDAWIDVQESYPRIFANQIAGIPTPLPPRDLLGGLIDGLVPPVPPPALHPNVNSAFLGRRTLFESAIYTGLDGEPHGLFGFTPGVGNLRMQLFIRALQQNQLLRILAEPNLVALNGQTADFLAGGEFPVPIPQGGGAGGVVITIEWKKFGVRLSFTPTVVGQQMIRLHVEPEVSEIDISNSIQLQGFVIPALSTRSASTTIELASGSTIAIGGLLSERVRASSRKLPGLGEVPILGNLFRSQDYQTERTELLILVTPELVSAMNPDQVPPVPGEVIAHPNDWQFYGLGMIEGEREYDAEADGALHSPVPLQHRRYTSPPEQMSLRGPWGPGGEDE